MKIVEELNKEWQVQGFSKGAKLEEVKQIKEGWIAAQVPGVVHLDLLREQKLIDPFYGLQEKDAYWVEKKEWWYKTEFSLNEFNSQRKRRKKVELVFEGLDTFASIYLNGEKVGEADNMFIPWRFDVTDKIREKNILLIKFSSAISVLKEIQAKEKPLKAAEEPTRVYGRKAQYSFGWDWGPRLPGVGVWRKVYICSYDDMYIDWVGVESNLSKEKAEVKVDMEVSSSIDEEQVGKVLIYLDKKRVKEQNIEIESSSKHTLHLEIEKPILWYPKGYGSQHLYRLKVKLFNEKEELMDIFEERIGIREVQLVQEKDEEGESFYFKV
ncbi:glycoside hydrolase family 2 protein, partial [Candidatus Aerophobetes bacterium]|nr:glycoside hydrolase family 2 protein [Candidatus Aerophobetes bacterium]